MIINPNMSDDQIYDILESRLKLYTSLWFCTLTDSNYNLQFTSILLQVFMTKMTVDMIVCLDRQL